MNAVERVRVAEVMALDRDPIEPDPLEEYVAIGVRSFGRGIFHYEPSAGDKLGKLRYFVVKPQRLVISNIKAWEGAVAVSSSEDRGCVASNRFLIYDVLDSRISLSWARWFFLSEPGNELLQRASPGSADRNRTLARKRFEDLVIPLPPIEVQRRVARRLDRASLASARVASLVDRSRRLTRAAQVALATGENLSPTTVVTLGDVLEPSMQTVSLEADERYRIAGTYSFGNGLIDRGYLHGSETSYRTLTRLEEGNVVVSKLNGWEGAVAVVDRAFAGAHVSAEYPTFTVDRTRLLPDFFKGIARSPAFWEELDRSVRGSMVRRRRISADNFRAVAISLPSLEVQRQVAHAITRLERISDEASDSRAVVDAIVPAILNEEFSPLAD